MSEYRREDTASWDAQEVRRAQEGRQSAPARHPQSHHTRRRRRNPVLGLGGYLLFVLLASAILAGVGWMLGSDFCAFNRGAMEKATVEVTAEDSVSTVAEKLHDAGLITYKWFFKFYAGISHADRKIGIGTYELNSEMDYRALILGMHNSSGNLTAETVTVTIPEGYTVMQTIRLLAEKGVNTEENLLEAAKTANYDYSFIDNSSEDVTRLEGYLFPDTYQFYMGDDPENVIDKFLRNFDNKFTSDLYDALDALNDRLAQHMRQNAFSETEIADAQLSLYDLITVASLVEKETARTSESATIASVIYNRLCSKLYPCLEIDATIQYALAERKEVLSNADKGVLSPYNTYTNAGLPAGPIANPGMNSIRAALYPAETKYYFYALDTTGVHHFSETYYEHQNFLNELAGKDEEEDQQTGTGDETTADQTGDTADTENQTDG